jgi:hypothetical protein
MSNTYVDINNIRAFERTLKVINAEYCCNTSTLHELSSSGSTFLPKEEDSDYDISFPVLPVNCLSPPHSLGITAACVLLQIAEISEMVVSILFSRFYNLQFSYLMNRDNDVILPKIMNHCL